jgi:uncharacterized membrane protein
MILDGAGYPGSLFISLFRLLIISSFMEGYAVERRRRFSPLLLGVILSVLLISAVAIYLILTTTAPGTTHS